MASEAGPATRLTVVVVNWNAGDLLRRCLESVARHGPSAPHDVLVVDNASTDGSAEWLLAHAESAASGGPPLRVIANAENLGFARANNLAFARSDAPLLLLLNPDAELTAGAADALLATLAADPRAAACAPRLLNPDGSLQPSVWPAPPTPLQILFEGLRLHRLLPASLRARWLLGVHWDHTTRRAVDAFFGAAMLVRREALDDAGPFDESFALFGEDYEWCARARRAGWRLLFEPAAEVVHHGGRSAGRRWSAEEVERIKTEANSASSEARSAQWLHAQPARLLLHADGPRLLARAAPAPGAQPARHRPALLECRLAAARPLSVRWRASASAPRREAPGRALCRAATPARGPPTTIRRRRPHRRRGSGARDQPPCPGEVERRDQQDGHHQERQSREVTDAELRHGRRRAPEAPACRSRNTGSATSMRKVQAAAAPTLPQSVTMPSARSR